MNHPAPNPPYVGPPKWHGADNNKPISRIVLHSTVGKTVAGSARGVAEFFRHNTDPGSSHYIVDEATTLQMTYDSWVAYHAPPNQHSLGIEMCDNPSTAPGSLDRWNDTPHKRMLTRVVHLTAGLCMAYNVPPIYLTVDDLLAGKHGITTHNNVSLAFHQSTHWDPGSFPMTDFIDRVQSRINRLQKGEVK